MTSVDGIQLTPVVSSNVQAIGYNPDEMFLYVQFLNNSIYRYYSVPDDIWALFQTAPSKGQFIWTTIRGQFDYEMVVAPSKTIPVSRVKRKAKPFKLGKPGKPPKPKKPKKPKKKGKKDLTAKPVKGRTVRKMLSKKGKEIQARLRKLGIK